jgi:hypothetical protein
MTPDPHRDVIVYRTAMVDALSGVSIGDRWSVWIGSESQGSFENEAEAMGIARQLAIDEHRPVWLMPEGGRAMLLAD